MPDQFSRSRVRRIPKRGHYDEQTVYAILDAAYVGQVSFQMGDQPFQIPMLYGRKDNVLLYDCRLNKR